MAEYLDENALNVYVDGSSYSGPRRGGVGVLLIYVDDDGHPVEETLDVQGYGGATNNMMELQAPIEALRDLERRVDAADFERFSKIVFWSDSQYVVENWPRAVGVWPQRRWMTSAGNPVENVDQWKELVKRAGKTGKRVEFRKVKGHSKSAWNKAADKLAKASAKGRVRRPIGPPSTVRRKLSPNATERGSVEMRGQTELVRVIEASTRPQRLVRYRYEIVADDSDFFEKVDLVWADAAIGLRPGHVYQVRFNEEQAAPRIVELIGEIERPPEPA